MRGGGIKKTGSRVEIEGNEALLEAFNELPVKVQKLAEKNYDLWRTDHDHPSLGFKRLKGGSGERFSIRIGDHHRALGQREDDTVEWVWIGSHEEYHKL